MTLTFEARGSWRAWPGGDREPAPARKGPLDQLFRYVGLSRDSMNIEF